MFRIRCESKIGASAADFEASNPFSIDVSGHSALLTGSHRTAQLAATSEPFRTVYDRARGSVSLLANRRRKNRRRRKQTERPTTVQSRMRNLFSLQNTWALIGVLVAAVMVISLLVPLLSANYAN